MSMTMSETILIIDDEASIRDSVAGILSDEGFVPISASSAEEGLRIIEEQHVDLVLLDIWMPGMDGLEALKKIKEEYEHTPVIMISGHGTIETAVQATRIGAVDFIEKPPSYDKIVLAIQNGLKLSRLQEENRILRQQAYRNQQLIGKSSAISSLRRQIEMVAPTDAWVLIRGEHGTGKEVVAQTIHQMSATADKPMIALNCAAIPEELIESELFGHEKGSFTGATTSKRGKFDQADGGLLFLDEIADMSLKTQAKILRILQEQKFERVGGSKTISVNVRVLAATNKNLEQEIEKGNFREDLYWRLNVVPITVPPLRDRLDDIPDFVELFSRELLQKGFSPREFSLEALRVMMNHSWPGNVRELRNFVERVLIMTKEEVISEQTVRLLLGQTVEPSADGTTSVVREEEGGTHDPAPAYVNYSGNDFREARRSFEHDFLVARLKENNGNISQTAEQIGLERSHLHKKIKSLGIEISG